MILKRHKNFIKSFKKLDPRLKIKTVEILRDFQSNPFSPHLYNYALKGPLLGKRAIKVTSDLRIIFQQFDDYTLVIMLDLGTHSQIY